MIETKAVLELEDAHLAQILNYLKAFRFKVGLIINFGSNSMKFKRLILDRGPGGLRRQHGFLLRKMRISVISAIRDP